MLLKDLKWSCSKRHNGFEGEKKIVSSSVTWVKWFGRQNGCHSESANRLH